MRIDLPWELESIEIEIFSDMHLGSRKCDYKAIQERVKRVAENDNVYAIVLGDMINNSTRTSVGDVYEESLTPMQQVQLAVNTLLPIKDKIIGICAGNHERRSYKEGVDLASFVASELGLLDRYDYAGCLLFIRLGRSVRHGTGDKKSQRQVSYTLYMTHGDGNGGRMVGGKANGLQRRGQIINADIIVAGHTHQPLTFRECYFEVDKNNSKYAKKEQVFVNASATLEYEEYAELYGMKPSSTISPKIHLNGRKFDVVVTI